MKDIIRYPRIDAPTTEGKVQQIKDFLFDLVDLLNRSEDETIMEEGDNGLQEEKV